MSPVNRQVRPAEPEAPHPDDWDHHWDSLGEAAEGPT
jgi:hypothetical protein